MHRKDYGAAYEEEIREVTDELRRARSEARSSNRTGRRCVQYVPSKRRTVPVDQLTDNQIREVAQFEAEKYTNRAINQRNERLA